MTIEGRISTPVAVRAWWRRPGLLVALTLLALVPVAPWPLVPLVDLPGHLARYRVELDLGQSADLQRYFDFHWQLIGNLGVDLLVIPLSALFGLEAAARMIVVSIPALTVAGMLWTAREAHGAVPPTAFLALPFALSTPYLFGFVNFALSMALALLALALWMRLARLGRRRLRAALFVPVSFLLFIFHVFGWGLFGLGAASAELFRRRATGEGWGVAALRSAPALALLAGPLLPILWWQGEAGGARFADWFNIPLKVYFVGFALRDRWMTIDVAMVALALFVIVASWRSPRFSRSPALSALSLVLLALYLVMPRTVFGSNFADMRLVPFVLALFLLSIRERPGAADRDSGLVAAGSVAFFAAKLAVTTASLAIAARDQQQAMGALAHIPRGAASIALVGDRCEFVWALPRMRHLGGMMTVRNLAFSNDHWNIAGANALSVHFPAAAPFVEDPLQIVAPNPCPVTDWMTVDQALAAVPRPAISHVWVIDLPPHDPAALAGYRLAWSSANSQLFVRDARSGAISSSLGAR